MISLRWQLQHVGFSYLLSLAGPVGGSSGEGYSMLAYVLNGVLLVHRYVVCEVLGEMC